MTEKERFTWEDVYKWEVPAFLEVMNGLDKKNQQLKKENEQLKQDRIEMFIRERDTKNEWRKLKEENEQLKKELDSFEQLHFIDMCDGSRTVLYMKKENVGDVE